MLIPDHRLTPANGRVAAAELKGSVEALCYLDGEWLGCRAALASIRSSPDGAIVSQLLHGERFRVLEDRSGWAFGQMERDGYVGYARSWRLGPGVDPTHRVHSLWTQIHGQPDSKSAPVGAAPFGALLAVSESVGDGVFFRLAGGGYVPSMHVRPAEEHGTDHAGAATRFLGAPYLWGGNSPVGIDCSGLVQLALMSVGIRCPRDSDMQEAELGKPVAGPSVLQRGDLVFWTGHVGIMEDAEHLIHATAQFMAVVRESLDTVMARIKQQGAAPFRGFRRL